jgi:hypothetical protein
VTNHKAIRALTEAVDFLIDKQEFDAAEMVSSLIDELMITSSYDLTTNVKLSGVELSETQRELNVDDCLATDVSHHFSMVKHDNESYAKRMQSLAQSV